MMYPGGSEQTEEGSTKVGSASVYAGDGKTWWEELAALRFLKNCQGQEEQIGQERFLKGRTEIYDLTIGVSFELKIKDFLNEWAMGETGYL